MESAPPGGWSGGCPMLLAARPLAHVVEDLAWLDARHPGLVGVAFVASFVEADFAAPGHEFATRRERLRGGGTAITRLSSPFRIGLAPGPNDSPP